MAIFAERETNLGVVLINMLDESSWRKRVMFTLITYQWMDDVDLIINILLFVSYEVGLQEMNRTMTSTNCSRS